MKSKFGRFALRSAPSGAADLRNIFARTTYSRRYSPLSAFQRRLIVSTLFLNGIFHRDLSGRKPLFTSIFAQFICTPPLHVCSLFSNNITRSIFSSFFLYETLIVQGKVPFFLARSLRFRAYRRTILTGEFSPGRI